MKPHIKLLRYCLLKKDSHHAKFHFRLENISTLSNHCISRIFNFSGHRWKVQVSKNHGCLGMFLRWYGTLDDSSVSPSYNDDSMQCTVCPLFAFLNIFIQEQSIVEGDRFTQDTFKKLKSGIGYGSMVTLDHLQSNAGYIVSDSLYLQMELKVVSTIFRDRLSCNPGISEEADENCVVKGRHFNYYGTSWSLVFYPKGEKDSLRLLEGEKDTKYSSIYLMRAGRLATGRLRHNVQYRISVNGRNDLVLDKHFYYKESNAYGTCLFIPIDTLKGLEELNVSVTFEHIVPYSYFAYTKNDIVGATGEKVKPYVFKDHCSINWSFTLEKSKNEQTDDDCTRGRLSLVRDKRVDILFKRHQDIQVCWFVEILSPVNIEESVSMETRSKRLVHDSFFNRYLKSDSIEFPVGVDQVRIFYSFYFLKCLEMD